VSKSGFSVPVIDHAAVSDEGEDHRLSPAPAATRSNSASEASIILENARTAYSNTAGKSNECDHKVGEPSSLANWLSNSTHKSWSKSSSLAQLPSSSLQQKAADRPKSISGILTSLFGTSGKMTSTEEWAQVSRRLGRGGVTSTEIWVAMYALDQWLATKPSENNQDVVDFLLKGGCSVLLTELVKTAKERPGGRRVSRYLVLVRKFCNYRHRSQPELQYQAAAAFGKAGACESK